MLQLIGIGVGILAFVMGILALAKGEIKLSAAKTLTGNFAKVAGILVMLFGLGIAAFMLVGLPLLMGR